MTWANVSWCLSSSPGLSSGCRAGRVLSVSQTAPARVTRWRLLRAAAVVGHSWGVAPEIADVVIASTDTIEVTASKLGDALGLVFEPHESSFRGGDYLLAGEQLLSDGEHVIVQRNDDGGEPAEPDTPAPTLVYVEGTGRADDVAAAAVAAGYELVRCEIRGSP
jgi:hypothetical protein